MVAKMGQKGLSNRRRRIYRYRLRSHSPLQLWRDEQDSEISRPFLPNAAAFDFVDLTLLRNAKDRGALCLDGTAPGYHFKKGFGSGANNWLLHIEGGGRFFPWEDVLQHRTMRAFYNDVAILQGLSKSLHKDCLLGMEPAKTWITETWHSPTSPRINNKTIAESVGDWYFGRNAVKQIDRPFPCNPTCYHMNFTAFSRG